MVSRCFCLFVYLFVCLLACICCSHIIFSTPTFADLYNITCLLMLLVSAIMLYLNVLFFCEFDIGFGKQLVWVISRNPSANYSDVLAIKYKIRSGSVWELSL